MKFARYGSLLSLFVLAMVFFPLPALDSQAVAASDIKVIVNGNTLKMDVEPVIIEQRTMVPMRSIFEALSTEVAWSPTTRVVTAYNSNTKIQLKIDDTKATVNQETVYIDVPPLIVNGRTLVPTRFVAESLGCEVVWNENTRTVNISWKSDANSKPADKPADAAQNTTVNNYKSGDILKTNETFKYCGDYTAVFKQGTSIAFHPSGKVSGGTLAEDSLLKFNDTTSAVFKANTVVSFSLQGWVIKGTLLNDTNLAYLASISGVGMPFVNTDGTSTIFKAGNEVTLNNSLVTSGVLLKDTTLRYASDLMTDFSAGSKVLFTPQGMVKEGVLRGASKLRVTDKVEQDEENTATFKDNTRVIFKDSGFVDSGILNENTELQYYHDHRATFAKDKRIVFNDDGYVLTGTLGKYCQLKFSDNREESFTVGAEVTFNNQGYVAEGILGTELNAQGGSFSDGMPISFWDNGKVKSATLKFDSTLEYAANKSAQFKMETLVEFNEAGYVSKGTIKRNEDLPYTNRYISNTVAVTADNEVAFDKDGYLIQATLLRDAILPYADKKKTTFKIGKITFENGYVKIGILQSDTKLINSSGQEISYPANSTVTFNSSGQVLNVENP